MSGTLFAQGTIQKARSRSLDYRHVEKAIDLDALKAGGNYFILNTARENLPCMDRGFLTVRQSEGQNHHFQLYQSLGGQSFIRLFSEGAGQWDEWIEMAPASADSGTRVGAMMYWPHAAPPEGWLVRNGAALSRTTYAALFALIGTTYGAGDGVTTFHLPDDRGNLERGWDSGAGIDRARGFALCTR